jgi:Protein tyrosine and serine/threonine kinase
METSVQDTKLDNSSSEDAATDTPAPNKASDSAANEQSAAMPATTADDIATLHPSDPLVEDNSLSTPLDSQLTFGTMPLERPRSESIMARLLTGFSTSRNEEVEDHLNDSNRTELDVRETILSEVEIKGSDVERLSRANSDAPALETEAFTLKPLYAFSYRIISIPIVNAIPTNLTIDDFSNIAGVSTPGSHAKILYALYQSKPVIIKMIKRESNSSMQAHHEFETEHNVLCRIDHPNVIRILGSGWHPRRFIVLEYLEGGTLSSKLRQNAVPIYSTMSLSINRYLNMPLIWRQLYLICTSNAIAMLLLFIEISNLIILDSHPTVR